MTATSCAWAPSTSPSAAPLADRPTAVSVEKLQTRKKKPSARRLLDSQVRVGTNHLQPLGEASASLSIVATLVLGVCLTLLLDTNFTLTPAANGGCRIAISFGAAS